MATSARNWSTFQTAIFADVANGEGHTVVRARAGTGKTTTIVEALRHVPAGKSVLMVAFNKKIAEELQSRAPGGVQVKTCHGFGYSALLGVRKARLDQHRVASMLRDRNPEWSGERVGATCKAVALAKGMLASTTEQIDDIIDQFSLDVPEFARAQFCADVLATLAWCKRDNGTCDFDDMVWLPVVLGTRVPQYDYVFVDETQDLNKAQIELAVRACRPGGRIVAVGDDRQAIYGFRGADERAMPALIERLSAKVLPLSVTYRCGKAIVDVAKAIVSDYEAAPSAPDGLVLNVGDERMKREAKPGDFVISRANAPLIGLCLDFLKRGVRANIAGRDVGASLLALVDKSDADTIPALMKYVDEWATAECARLAAKTPPRDSQSVEDRAECIAALAEGAKSVREVRDRIESLFSDKDDAARVMLTTTHKAKGLERERCWILTETYRPTRSTEEANLWYVAVTRAKSELYLVGSGSVPAPPEGPTVTPSDTSAAEPTVDVPPANDAPAEVSDPLRELLGLRAPNLDRDGRHIAPASQPLNGATVSLAAPVVSQAKKAPLSVSRRECKPVRFLGKCGNCKRPLSVLMTAEVRVGLRQYAESDAACHVYSNGIVYIPCCGRDRALRQVRGVYSEKHKCDSRCMASKGTSCECSCGGANHGANYA